MDGKRIYPDVNGRLWPIKAGEYGQHGWTWYGSTPNGLLVNFGSHNVVEHDDGTITASPEITVGDGNEGWRGELKRGVWSET